MAIYQAAYRRFGHRHWWPGDTKLEVCVGAILTQNTNWTNVEKAIANLKAAGAMSVAALHALPHAALAELIRPAGYFNIKARRLKNFVAHVAGGAPGRRVPGGGTARQDTPGQTAPGVAAAGNVEHAPVGEDLTLAAFLDRPAGVLREELLGINGIGRETADSIILYAAGQPVFVVDAYTCRVLLRHRLISEDYDYEMVKELLETNLPRDVALYNDFHAQFVAVGKNYCRPAARCEGWGPQSRCSAVAGPCPLEHLPHDRLAGTDGT